jgi:hypothetical protein
MKQKHIDASREARLWLSQIIIPIVGIVMMVPETREKALTKAQEMKESIKAKFGKNSGRGLRTLLFF